MPPKHMGGDLTFAVFCSAFLSTGFMWWIYFHHGQEKAADKAEATSEPESVALNLFTYGHLPIVAGIIIAAVGQDLSLFACERGKHAQGGSRDTGRSGALSHREYLGETSRCPRDAGLAYCWARFAVDGGAAAAHNGQLSHPDVRNRRPFCGGFVGIYGVASHKSCSLSGSAAN